MRKSCCLEDNFVCNAEAGTLYSLLSEGKADTGQCRYNDVDIDIDAFDACGGIMVTSKRAFVDRLEKQRRTCCHFCHGGLSTSMDANTGYR